MKLHTLLFLLPEEDHAADNGIAYGPLSAPDDEHGEIPHHFPKHDY